MISACMIVRDGEETLRKALSSVRSYVDEIVVAIDSRTKDGSRAIAEQLADIVFDYEWEENFAAARNLVASRASNDWILVVDADDCIEPGKEAIFRDAITKGNGIRFTIQTSKNTSIRSIRCYNRKQAKYVYRVHEYLSLNKDKTSQIVDVDIIIHHSRGSTCIDPGRNIRILEEALSEYPRYLFYHGRECLDAERYQEAIKDFEKYLEVSTWLAEENEALLGIARAYVRLNDLEAAKKFSLSILVNDENFIPAYNLLGQIAQVQGRWQDACRWYECSLNCQPTSYVFNDINAVIFNSFGNLILVYHNLGNRSGVKKAIRGAQKIEPDSEWIQNNIKAVLK